MKCDCIKGRRRENSGDINTTSVGSTESRDSSENLEQYQDSETRMKMQIRKVRSSCIRSLPVTCLWPRGYRTFFMLNLAEHEIYPAHKCKNATIDGILTFMNRIDEISIDYTPGIRSI